MELSLYSNIRFDWFGFKLRTDQLEQSNSELLMKLVSALVLNCLNDNWLILLINSFYLIAIVVVAKQTY